MRDLKASEISVKVKQITEKGCLLLLYKTARVDAQILDEEFGAANWTNDFKEIKGNLFCGIGVKQEDGSFVWKWDCGTESTADAEKGEASDSFKRAGFKWGIGVELYTSPFIWASVETQKNGKGFYELTNKFIKFSVSEIVIEDKKITKLKVIDNKGNVVFEMGKNKKKAEPVSTAKQQTLEERISKFKEYIGKASLYDLNDLKYKSRMDALCREAGPEISEELTQIHNKRMMELADA